MEPEPTVTVRTARPDDAATITAFNLAMAMESEGLKLDRATLEQGVAAALGDPGKAIYFVAEVDGQLAGQLMITHEWSDWRNGDIWWIQSVYVHPNHRRRGVFRALYRHVESEAKARGAVKLRLYVEHENESAQRTYSSLGLHRSRYFVMETDQLV
jgi:ribosomal protein S18 acetylase RimI-like enzyme